MKPSLFHGIAASTCLGLALGLVMHGPWLWRAGGPQILAPSAAATELARAPGGSDAVETAAPEAAYADNAYADMGQLPPTPLPVVRLTGPGGAALPAAADVERVSAEAAQQDDKPIATVGQFRDDDVLAAGDRAFLAARYGQTDGGR
ncbi:MAG: hypothetical protein JWO72_2102 [Caulobacteraceae bacterium]|nr:hypothetical protein [Caulobacteraceae bacterium]